MHRPATSTTVARTFAAVGLAFGVAYLAWRWSASWDGSTVAVNALLLVVETIGFAGSALLIWAFWNGPRPRPAHWEHEVVDDIDIVIDAVGYADQTHLLAATMASVQRVERRGQVFVVCGREETAQVAALAEALDASVRDLDPSRDPLVAAAAWVGDRYLYLGAGDVVHPDALAVLNRGMSDPKVGAVQAETLIVADDRVARETISGAGDILHGPNGDDLDHFGRNTLNAALSAHGAATITSTGVLLRRAAVQRAVLDERSTGADVGTRRSNHLMVSVALMAGGWTVNHVAGAGGGALVARQPLRAAARRAASRAELVLAHRQVVTARFGVLRRRRIALRQRLGVLAGAVIGLGSMRRLVVTSLLVACLLGGYVPFHPTALPIGVMWAPSFVLVPVALAMLSGWALRPGDRARASVRDLAATVTALAAPRSSAARRPLTLTDARSTGWVVAMIGVVATAGTVRAVSERVTGALGVLPRPVLEGLYVAALWTVAVGCDCMRLLTRRAGQRRAQRLVTTTPASIGGAAAVVVDMTPLGVGVLTDHAVEVGSVVPLEFVVLADSGCTTVRLEGLVRNARGLDGGRVRLGVEFVEPSLASTIALSELTIVEPSHRRLGARAVAAVEEGQAAIVDERQPVSAVRRGARAAAIITICGAVASVAPLQARAGSVTEVTGTVVGTSATVEQSMTVVTLCAEGTGPDGTWGTADDDTVSVERTSTSARGWFSIDVVGTACWIATAATDEATSPWRAIDMNSAAMTVDLAEPTAGAASMGSRRAVPDPSMIERSEPPLGRSGFTMMALAFAVMLAGAVLLGIRQPLRDSAVPALGYSSGSSPDFAIR
jgi:hypothetical protein